MGIETFDPEVIKTNLLNSPVPISFKAVEMVNKYGSERGRNGMPKFLPGINILFGLEGESSKTHDHNMKCLKKMMSNRWNPLEKNLIRIAMNR